MQHVGKIKGRWAAQAAAQQAAARRSVTLNDIAGGTVVLPSSYGMIRTSTGSGNAGNPCSTDPGMCGGTAFSHGGNKRDTLNVNDPNSWTKDGYLQSWSGEKNIAFSGYWTDMISQTRNRVHGMSWISLLFRAASFDTPFYNNGLWARIFNQEPLSGRGCFGENCYDRSELNYVAQGELWAAMGLSKTETLIVVTAWKGAIYDHAPSEGAYEMTITGWEDYNAHYPSSRGYLILSPALYQALKEMGE